MKIDDLIARADELKKQDPPYILRYDDGTTETLSGHNALMAAIRSSCGAGGHLVDIEATGGGCAVVGLAKAILHPVSRK